MEPAALAAAPSVAGGCVPGGYQEKFRILSLRRHGERADILRCALDRLRAPAVQRCVVVAAVPLIGGRAAHPLVSHVDAYRFAVLGQHPGVFPRRLPTGELCGSGLERGRARRQSGPDLLCQRLDVRSGEQLCGPEPPRGPVLLPRQDACARCGLDGLPAPTGGGHVGELDRTGRPAGPVGLTLAVEQPLIEPPKDHGRLFPGNRSLRLERFRPGPLHQLVGACPGHRLPFLLAQTAAVGIRAFAHFRIGHSAGEHLMFQNGLIERRRQRAAAPLAQVHRLCSGDWLSGVIQRQQLQPLQAHASGHPELQGRTVCGVRRLQKRHPPVGVSGQKGPARAAVQSSRYLILLLLRRDPGHAPLRRGGPQAQQRQPAQHGQDLFQSRNGARPPEVPALFRQAAAFSEPA